MNKLANALSMTGLSLAAFSTFSQVSGYFKSSWSVLGSTADEALVLSAVLLLLAVFVKFSATPTSQPSLARDVRIFFWIGAILVLSISSCLIAEKVTVP